MKKRTYIDKQIEDLISRNKPLIESGEKEPYKSYSQIARELGFSKTSILSSEKRKKRINESGIYDDTLIIDKQIEDLISRDKPLIESGKKEPYKSYSQIARELGISESSFTMEERKRRINESGICEILNIDKLIEDLISRDKPLIESGKKEPYTAYIQIIKELNIGNSSISSDEKRKKRINESGIYDDTLIIDKLLEDLISRDKPLIESGEKEPYSSYSQIARELDISESSFSMKERKKKINESGIYDDTLIIDKLIDDLIIRDKPLIESGEKEPYSSYSQIMTELDISKSSFNNKEGRKQRINESGIYDDTSIIDKLLEDLISRDKPLIESGEKEPYSSYRQISKELDISDGCISLNKKRKQSIDESGIRKPLDIDTLIEDLINRDKHLIKKGRKKAYTSYSEIAEELNISGTSINNSEERKRTIYESGIYDNTLIIDKLIEDLINRDKPLIESGKKEPYKFYSQIARELNIGEISINEERKKRINSSGIRKVLDVNKLIEDLIIRDKPLIESGKKEPYKSYRQIAKELDINIHLLNEERKKRINSSGIRKVLDINKLIEDLITRDKPLIESGKKEPYKSYKKIAIEIEVNYSTFYNKEAIKRRIHDSGILEKNEIKSHIKNTISYCIDKNISFDSIDAFYAYSVEQHNIIIHETKDLNEKIVLLYPEIFKPLDNLEALEIVNKILLELSIEEHIWYMTIKLEFLYNHNIYISDDNLNNILQALSLNAESFFCDSIYKRFSYAIRLCKRGYGKIKYINNNLPEINDTDSVIIKNSINNKEIFISLWKEYLVWYISNGYSAKIVKAFNFNWDKNLKKLIAKYPSYGKKFFLDDDFIEDFIELKYEGVITLITFALSKTRKKIVYKDKEVLIKYKELRVCLSGFLLWLLKKDKGLSHPRFLILDDNINTTSVSRELMKEHKVHIYHNNLVKGKISVTERSKLLKEKISLHCLFLSTATRFNFDIKNIERKSFLNYYNLSKFYVKSFEGIKHSFYIERLCDINGNPSAKTPPKEKSFDSYFREQVATIDKLTLSNYNDLIYDFKESIILLIKKQGNSTMIHYCRAIRKLLEFLSLYNERLNRNQMSNALNTIITNKAEHNLIKWAEKNGLSKTIKSYLSYYYRLFESTSIKEYENVFKEKWKTIEKSTKNDGLGFIKRKGLKKPIYETLQYISYNMPVKSTFYQYITTSPTGEQLDMSWWEHDEISPIPTVCLWLMTKIPRRSAHVTSLDVNRFIVERDGLFLGLYFNTDKNPDMALKERDFIDEETCKMIFEEFELEFLFRYVNYIKQAYSYMSPIKYRNGGNYNKIKPLFPCSKGVQCISYSHLLNIFNKTMLKTQFHVQERAKNGDFDLYYSEELKQREIKNLTECRLLEPKDNIVKELPKTLEEFENLNWTDGIYGRFFSTIDHGLHTLRVSGATQLVKSGKSINTVMILTGHADLNVLVKTYIKLDDTKLLKVIKATHPDINFDSISSIIPTQIANKLIHEVTSDLIENSNPIELKEMLVDNGYSCLSVFIESNDKSIYGATGEVFVDDGVDIASRYNPIGVWEVMSYGICTMKNRCPPKIYKLCSLCPHLMFNIYHIKGIVKKMNDVSLEINLLRRNMRDCYERKLRNSVHDQIVEDHERKVAEYMGYIQIKGIIERKFKNIKNNNNKSLVDYFSDEDLIGVEASTLIELRLEIAKTAEELKIYNLEEESNIKAIAYEMLENAIYKQDFPTIEKLKKNKLKPFLLEYRDINNLKEKREFLNKYFILDYIDSIDYKIDNKIKLIP